MAALIPLCWCKIYVKSRHSDEEEIATPDTKTTINLQCVKNEREFVMS